MVKRKREKRREIVPLPLRLDLGCGDNKREGFQGVDLVKTPSTDVVCDLLALPWPWGNETVAEVHCSHFFEHIPGPLRGTWMDELYRVLVPSGTAMIIVPYAGSFRSIQDYTHAWPPVHESSFLYFNRAWREGNKLTHGAYALVCDFDFTYGYVMSPMWASRNDEARTFALMHYWNVAADLQVVLTKRIVDST